MHLDDCALDNDLVVRGVAGPASSRARMYEIGLHAGAVVRVTHRGPAGGRVIAVGGARVAIDAATAGRVEVEAL